MKDIYKDTPDQSEDELQQKCFFWFTNTFPHLRKLLFHIPNGGARNKREARRFKEMGVVAGVSDFMLLYNGCAYCIELKVKNRQQSPKQIEWQGKVQSHGIFYEVVWNLVEFKHLIRKIVF